MRAAAGTLLGAGVLVASSLCACGSDRPAADSTPTPGPPSPTASARATPRPRPAVDITRPARGASVAAEPAGHGRLRATIAVSGFAPPGSRVSVRSGCGASGCRGSGRADDGGMWRIRLRLTGSGAHPAATISATCSVPGPPRRRVVRLHAARHAAKRAHPAAPPRAAPAPSPTATLAPAPRHPHRLVLIGDSLAVGIQGLLPSLLPGWTVTADALTGRSLAAGMQLAAGADLTSRPTVLAVSLFTNDDPRATAALAAAVQRSVSLVGPHGCAVWATIVRPPYRGVSYAAANATLRRLSAQDGGALLLVPWAEEVSRHPGWVAPDRVHGTPTGYEARARMYAQAALACSR